MVCRIQNIARRAVVLLQPDDPGIRIFFLKIKDIADIRAPELIDRLIVIPDNTQIPVFACQQTDQSELHSIRILIFIYHNITESLLVAFQHIRLSVQQLHCFHQKIIEIQSIIRPKLRLILPVYLRDL